MRPLLPPKLAAGGLVLLLTASACASEPSSSPVDLATAPGAVDEAAPSEAVEPEAPAAEDEPAPVAESGVAEPAADDVAPAESAAPVTEDAEAVEPVPAGPNNLPAVVVDDVLNGTQVDFSTFAPADRPIVVWFWAPH